MKHSRRLQSLITTKNEPYSFLIILPYETERLSFPKRQCLPLLHLSRKCTKRSVIPFNHTTWLTERGPLRLNVLTGSGANVINSSNAPIEWAAQLPNTLKPKFNSTNNPTSVKSKTSSRSSVIVTVNSVKTSRLLDTPSCQYLEANDENTMNLPSLRGVKIEAPRSLHKKTKTEVNSNTFTMPKKKLRWYHKRPRVIINEYYEYNFIGNREKILKSTNNMQGVISRISTLLADKNENYISAVDSIEANKIKT